MKRVPVVEREANKFFETFGFMARDDAVVKGVEKT
jgi:N-acetylglutamate synthase-like GNAT family acetyltransferase